MSGAAVPDGHGRRGLVTPGRTFRDRSRVALRDPELGRALRNLDRRLDTARAVEADAAAEKDWAAAMRRATLADLDGALARLEARLVARGVTVHHAESPASATATIAAIARTTGATSVVKSKSMATEEIELDVALGAIGLHPVETDLGEYIVQVAGERPSHMITPAIHKTLEQIRRTLEADAGRALPDTREGLTAHVRSRLREVFLASDFGVTGVNFAAADTGTLVLVTNEGNGRFCTSWPRVHVAVMPVEKVVEGLSDVARLLPLLTRSATAQRLTNYVSLLSGPRRDGEVDGPDELHVVILDNRRRALLGTRYEEMLACIRCGACLNVCPVYRRVGGHAYDAVYSGPMGAVLTPLLSGGEEGCDLPHASTLCGACSDACPVRIPLAEMITTLRADLVDRAPNRPPSVRRGRATLRQRVGLGAWSRVWSSRRGYEASVAAARVVARATRRGWLRRAPLARWTTSRDLPLPASRSFRARWAARQDRSVW